MTELCPYGSVSSGEWNPLRSRQQLTSATLAQKKITVKRLAKKENLASQQRFFICCYDEVNFKATNRRRKRV
jgi:hypothetical protein